jgi:phosphoribosyl-dephospho-CoA transferase
MKQITETVRNRDGELLQVSETVETSEQNSVELTIDSKGNVKPTVKVYDISIDNASKKAQEILDELTIKYNITINKAEKV